MPNLSGSQPDGYYIHRSYASTLGPYIVIDTVTDTAYYDSVTIDYHYYYKVSAYNGVGQSALSSYAGSSLSAPPAPLGMSASQGIYPTHVALSWHPSSGAVSYTLYRSTYSSSGYTAIIITADTASIDSTAAASTRYYYRVSARSALKEGSQSSYVQGWVLSPPGRPTVSSGIDHITLSWSAALTADGYGIYRSTSTTPASFVRIDSIGISPRVYYDTVTTSSTYYYKLTAFCSGLESEQGIMSVGAQRQLPSPPTGISATDGTLPDSVRVTWNASSGADYYKLYRDIDAGFANPVLVGSPTITQHTDTVTSDVVFYYRVKACNAAGESVLSSADQGFRMPPTVPDGVQNVAASDSFSQYIRVSWSPPAGGVYFNGYTVYRSSTETGTYSFVDSTNTEYYFDYVPQTFPTTYWYKVKAYNAVGEGPFSTAAEGTRK
jgi:fibronectin type 3 domain-containing protein